MHQVEGLMKSKPVRVKAMLGRVEWALKLLNEQKPKGRVTFIELGLWKGDFSQLMLDSNSRFYGIGIDPYHEYGTGSRKQGVWDRVFTRVRSKFEPYGKRFRLIRKPSQEAIRSITRKVDLVFIDGDHDVDAAYEDIRLYEKKVKRGGILSGHDYVHRVSPAVDAYVETFGRNLFVDTSFDPCGVFWWRVP